MHLIFTVFILTLYEHMCCIDAAIQLYLIPNIYIVLPELLGIS